MRSAHSILLTPHTPGERDSELGILQGEVTETPRGCCPPLLPPLSPLAPARLGGSLPGTEGPSALVSRQPLPGNKGCWCGAALPSPQPRSPPLGMGAVVARQGCPGRSWPGIWPGI